MNRFLIVVFVFLGSVFSVEAEEALYTVSIADEYYAKVFLENKEEVSSEGWIGVYDKKSDKELIRVDSPDLFVDYDAEGNVSVNVVELPYGSQSVIIYDDFNFDGIKDFAIRNGNMSCYGGPSYEVYLADGKGGFVYSDDFTDLGQNYCGFFSVDAEKKRIYTMTKSGCCRHWFYMFDVVDNKPRMRQETEESMSYSTPFIFQRIITDWDASGKKTEKSEDFLYLEDKEFNVIFSFDLKDKNRKVMLIDGNKTLYYVFVKQNKLGDLIAEFYYPSKQSEETEDTQKMIYNVLTGGGEETLTFANPSAQYQLYNAKDRVGIRVTTKGKVYDMKGDPMSRNVTYFFDKLKGVIFDNVNFDTETRLDSTIK